MMNKNKIIIKKNKIIKWGIPFLISSFLISCGSMTKFSIPSPEPVTKNVETKTNQNSNFIKANEWMVQSFNDAKSVIQFKDKKAGIVNGKYLMKTGFMYRSDKFNDEPSFYSVITIRVKDSLSRIEINAPSVMYSKKLIDGTEVGFTKESFFTKANVLVEQFEVYMKKESTNDNW